MRGRRKRGLPSARWSFYIFGRRDCKMTRWRPCGLVFKVRRVWGGLWAVFCKLFFISDLGGIMTEYVRI